MTEECSQCGDVIPSDEWHPVTTRRDDDGSIDIYGFCNERCRTTWQIDRGDLTVENGNADSRDDGGDGDPRDDE